MDELVSIYTLIDPRDQQVRYVGLTIRPKIREWQHLRNEDAGNARHRWVSELRDLGLRPVFQVIETCTPSEARNRERFWIRFFTDRGAALTNFNENMGHREVSREVRAKISAALVGHPVSEQTKEKLRCANEAQFADDARRKKHADAMRSWSATLPSEKTRPVIANLKAGQSGKFADNVKMQEGRRRWLAEHPDKAAKLTENFGGKTQWTETTPEERSERLRQRWANRTPEQRDAFRMKMREARAKYAQEHPEAMKESAARARAAKEPKR